MRIIYGIGYFACVKGARPILWIVNNSIFLQAHGVPIGRILGFN